MHEEWRRWDRKKEEGQEEKEEMGKERKRNQEITRLNRGEREKRAHQSEEEEGTGTTHNHRVTTQFNPQPTPGTQGGKKGGRGMGGQLNSTVQFSASTHKLPGAVTHRRRQT